jgi:hypothetical protein
MQYDALNVMVDDTYPGASGTGQGLISEAQRGSFIFTTLI